MAQAHSYCLLPLQELSSVKQQVSLCHERLSRLPKQAELRDTLCRSFEGMAKAFHEDCERLYTRPSFQVSFPETLGHELQGIRDAIHSFTEERRELAERSEKELNRVEQEIKKTEQVTWRQDI